MIFLDVPKFTKPKPFQYGKGVTVPRTEIDFRDATIATLYPATADARGFFESVLGFSDLANCYIRVSASDQRRYFGSRPFGKCAIKVTERGIIKIIKTKAFGRDWDSSEFIFDHVGGWFRGNYEGSPIIKYPALAV